MGQTFEVTKEGIKLSYVRFLSDSAAGYILLLLFGVAFSLRLPMPFWGMAWLNIIPGHLGTEDKVFLFFISLLIATPLGLTLNGISWFLLGALHVWLLRFWEWLPTRASFLVLGTRRSYQVDKTAQFLHLHSSPPSEPIYEQANYYEQILSIYFPTYYDQLEPVRGLRLFIRSLSLLALVTSMYSFLTLCDVHTGKLTLIVFGFLLLFSSLLEYYQCSKVLFMVYSLSSSLHSLDPSREKIVEHLIGLGEKLR
jgi:hypothetical protein